MQGIDAIVAGAGIWGCVIARRLAEVGKRVCVLEKRAVVGGNAHCTIDPETGIEIHDYGSHIFHTHIREVWEYVNRFVAFNGYQHKVLAHYQGRKYHLPLGLTLINKFFDVELKPNEVQPFLDGTFTPPVANRLRSSSDRRAEIFDAFFRGYTSKQWGRSPEEIDPTIIQRIPVRGNYDTNYFDDYWQGIPSVGYNALFDHLLKHPNIAVETEMTVKIIGKNLRAVRNPDSLQPLVEVNCAGKQVYYSGPIDSLLGYQFGALPWRTLRFEQEVLETPDYQGTSVVNFAELEIPYTRIHEFKHYHPEGKLNNTWGIFAPKTIIMREYSDSWRLGDEPYYPVNNIESEALLSRYREAASKVPNLVVGGRLGQYKYFDMDKTIEAALKVEV